MASPKLLYTVGGVMTIALGVAGIVLPLLPTTPFLLLAAFLLSRGSPRMHDWLLGHKYLGPYIRAFRDKTGLTATQKVRIVTSLTIILGFSWYYASSAALECVILAVWGFWTVVVIRMKTAEKPPEARAHTEREST